ncbi:MAG: CAP domain-containing protein [Verrucomicrobiales bacterium]
MKAFLAAAFVAVNLLPAGPVHSQDGERGGLFGWLRKRNSSPAREATSVRTSQDQATSANGEIEFGLGQADIRALVDLHNQARREVGVEPVEWNPRLARFAQEWADELARTGEFKHRPRQQHGYGENLASGTTGSYTAASLAGQWYAEKRLFRGNPAFGRGDMPAAHYTQMIWRNTTEIGAGIAVCRTGPYRGMTILVCNYNPPGNVIGEPVH